MDRPEGSRRQADGRDSWRSHQVPIAEMATKPAIIASYSKLDERATGQKNCSMRTAAFVPELPELAPNGERRMGANPHANGGLLLKDLATARFPRLCGDVFRSRGRRQAEATASLATFLRDMITVTMRHRNFRIWRPDETHSNRLGAVFEATTAVWMAETERQTTTSPRAGRTRDGSSERTPPVRAGWRAIF